ncbi:MAG: hypothetical protein WBF03_08525, partial [Xanthobacteraceae bacterium]
PELFVLAFWPPAVLFVKLVEVPELVQVSVLPLVLHTNCARAEECGHSSDITPKTASQTAKYDRGRSIGDGTREISIGESILRPPGPRMRTRHSRLKCIIAAQSKAKCQDRPQNFFVHCDKMAT